MKTSKRLQYLLYTTSLVCLWFLLIFSVLSIGGCTNVRPQKNKDKINCISFSHDGKKILFDRQKGQGPYLINVYDLETGELSAYQPPADEHWSMARYSFDGKHIVFAIVPRKGNRLSLDKMQIAIMDPDGKNVRKITTTNRPKKYPSFSHYDNKVIFAKAADIRKSGHTPAAGYDVYEVDINTGIETRLTWFNAFLISPPYEFPDGETIIFGAYGIPGINPKINEAHDNIYIVKKGEKSIPEPLVSLGSNTPFLVEWGGTNNPLVSWDGKKIFFQGYTLKADGIHGEGAQYYEYSTNGEYRRLTYIPSSSIWSATVSFDGQFIAVIFDPVYDSIKLKKIGICNVKDGTMRSIDLPEQPSRIINNYIEGKAEQNASADAA